MAGYGLIPDGTNTPTEILASDQFEKKGVMLANSVAAVAASLTTSMTGDNNDITVTAVDAGVAGNQLELALVDPSGNDQDLAVTVSDGVITASLATGAAGAITSTAAEVVAAINASADASALVTAAVKTGDDGTGVVTALAATNLTGGTAGDSADYDKGTVMGIITASGKWAEYNDSASDGTEVAKGILDDAYGPLTEDTEASVYIHGSFIEANLTGLDSNAKTDLGGRTVDDVFTF